MPEKSVFERLAGDARATLTVGHTRCSGLVTRNRRYGCQCLRFARWAVEGRLYCTQHADRELGRLGDPSRITG